jgi:hypothetical protein
MARHTARIGERPSDRHFRLPGVPATQPLTGRENEGALGLVRMNRELAYATFRACRVALLGWTVSVVSRLSSPHSWMTT